MLFLCVNYTWLFSSFPIIETTKYQKELITFMIFAKIKYDEHDEIWQAHLA